MLDIVNAIIVGNFISFVAISSIISVIMLFAVRYKKKRIERECSDALNDIFGRG